MGKRGDMRRDILTHPRNSIVSAGILFMAAPSGISTTLTPSSEPHFTFTPNIHHEHRWHYRGSSLVYSRLYYALAANTLLPAVALRVVA